MKNTTVEALKYFKQFSKKSNQEKKDEAKITRLSDDNLVENQQLLERARMFHSSLAEFRQRRLRAFNYYRGRQWSDLITDDNGETVTEENYIQGRGKVAFKHNIIRQLIRNIIGQMLSSTTKSIVNARDADDASLSEMFTNTLQSIQQLNKRTLIDARNFEEFLMSGMMFNKTIYKYYDTKDKEDVFTENVSPDYMFFNTDMKDVRGTDLRLIGQLIDIPLEQVVSSFALNEKDAKKIRSWYTSVSPKNIAVNTGDMGSQEMANIDFYIPSQINMARVIEIWEKTLVYRVYAHDKYAGTYSSVDLSLKEIDVMNADRIEKAKLAGYSDEEISNILIEATKRYESVWVVKFLTPFGQCLFQSETKYNHQEHPYTMTAYPLINGESWGLVEDIIDQQRNINRSLAIIDFSVGVGAKGILFVSEDSIPRDMDIDDYADAWTKMGSVIKIKTKNGVPLPKQITTDIKNVNIIQGVLEMQMKAIQDIAGVGNAIQGHAAGSGTPNSRYVNEAANSSINVKDIFNTFNCHKKEVDEKELKVAMQFYKEKRYIDISGNRYSEEAKYYSPEKITNFDFDLVISEGTDTPVFRQLINEQLIKLLDTNKIDTKMYLEVCEQPYAEKLLAAMKSQEEEVQKNAPEQQAPVQAMGNQ